MRWVFVIYFDMGKRKMISSNYNGYRVLYLSNNYMQVLGHIHLRDCMAGNNP